MCSLNSHQTCIYSQNVCTINYLVGENQSLLRKITQNLFKIFSNNGLLQVCLKIGQSDQLQINTQAKVFIPIAT